jgi:hypothetical protein
VSDFPGTEIWWRGLRGCRFYGCGFGADPRGAPNLDRIDFYGCCFPHPYGSGGEGDLTYRSCYFECGFGVYNGSLVVAGAYSHDAPGSDACSFSPISIQDGRIRFETDTAVKCLTTARSILTLRNATLSGEWGYSFRGGFEPISWDIDCTGSQIVAQDSDLKGPTGSLCLVGVTGGGADWPDLRLRGACKVSYFGICKGSPWVGYGEGNVNPGPMIAADLWFDGSAEQNDVEALASIVAHSIWLNTVADFGETAIRLAGPHRVQAFHLWGSNLNATRDIITLRKGAQLHNDFGPEHAEPEPGSKCTIGALGRVDYPTAQANDLAAGPLSELCAIHR